LVSVSKGGTQTYRVFENRMLRRLFGPRRDEVTGGWRKLHDEELRDLCSSPSIIRMIMSWRVRLADHVAQIVDEKKVYRTLMREAEVARSV
jgi:hypothetical protein